ncbi:MAG: fatty acid desaturase [Crocosphaera sp.]|nr:fatty acid desaturase [Crocosphaera sp.]
MFLKYPEDRINFWRACTCSVIFLYPFWGGLPPNYEIVTVIFLWFLLNDINHLLHLHIHCPFTEKKWLNLFLDISLGIVTGMTASNWRIQHKYGHHCPQVGDYCPGHSWEMEKFSILGSVYYSLRSIFPIFFKPLKESFLKGFQHNQTFPLNYRWAFIEQFLFILLVICLTFWKPLLGLGYLLPWYLLVYFVTRYTDYLNHFGCHEDYYRISNNCLNQVDNRLCYNFGYHTAHHLYPDAHWSTLPEIHQRIETKIPQCFKKEYSWSGFLMPYHFFLSLKGKM